MKEWFSAIESIGAKIGIPAALFAGWLYLQVTDLQDTVTKLDQTTKELYEVRQKIASMDAKLEIILSDFVAKRSNGQNDRDK